MHRRTFVGGTLAATLLGPFASAAIAQTYPDRPIKFVVGYPPGGNLDIIARVVGQRLSERLGQPVIVENKPGADARIATKLVAQAPADGYTLLVGGSGQMVFNPALYKNLGYDALKDFVPITLFGTTPQVFAADPKLPIKSMRDLAKAAHIKPEGLMYSSGATPFFAAGELFKTLAKVKLSNVPYKGNVQAVQAAMAGDVAVVVADLPTTLSQIRSGKLRALAVTGERRSSFLPQTPTMIESGYDFYSLGWTGLFAPAGTPQWIVDKLYNTLASVLKSPEMREQIGRVSFDASDAGMSPAELGDMHRKELERWTRALGDLNIHGEQS
ncbi:MAG: LacI family transcriptional regulator [Herminiimonas sp.]|nr:LacI family transcriptional regulator [Herminiimonas sp.]